MKCENNKCEVKFFNESLEDYVAMKKRYSKRLTELLVKITLLETAEGGARLLKERKINVSGDKLLQLAKAYEHTIDKDSITQIGIDDFALKKHKYGTVFVNSDNNRVIEIIGSRETEKVQQKLNEYKNLRYLSRDRGTQYKSLDKKYEHVADHFHLIKNISEIIIEALKINIAKRFKINISMDKPNDIISPVTFNNEKTQAHKNKIAFIELVRREYNKNHSYRKTAEILKIDRKTVKKYVEMKEIEIESRYECKKFSYLDPYFEKIKALFYEGNSIKYIFHYLNNAGAQCKYGNLRNYIYKNFKNAIGNQQ